MKKKDKVKDGALLLAISLLILTLVGGLFFGFTYLLYVGWNLAAPHFGIVDITFSVALGIVIGLSVLGIFLRGGKRG